MLPELEKLEAGDTRSPWENLLYFAARPYFADPRVNGRRKLREREEEERGIYHIEPRGAIDVGVQVIDLARLDVSSFDPRVTAAGETINPGATDAIIVNINYPLGFSAYHLMSQIATVTDRLMGIYILGKAATLNGRIGDVMLANSVFDEHSGNTYCVRELFRATRTSRPISPTGPRSTTRKRSRSRAPISKTRGTSISITGRTTRSWRWRPDPILDAIYEDLSLERHPTNEAVNLAQVQERIDLGIIHYASDTPYTRAQTLGARGMSFHGMESTYASTIAILRRVFMKSGVIAATGTVEQP